MRPLRSLMFGIAMSLAVATAHAEDGSVYVVTYVDVMPSSVMSGGSLLKQYRDASRKENGSVRLEVLQEVSRPNRFAVVEVWKDKAARDAHVAAASTTQFHDKLKAIQNAPYDERINNGLYVGTAPGQPAKDAIYVLTHVDVVPPSKDDTISLLKGMSTDTPKDAGNVSYNVLQQQNRANHFTVFETWANNEALDGHAMAAHTRAFRDKLAPMAGALYDERFYRELS